MAKLSRKQLLKSPDDFLTFTEKAGKWVVKNQRRLLIGGIVLVVAAGLVLGLITYNSRHQAAGALAYGQAFYTYKVTQANPSPAAWAGALQQLTKVATDYASTNAGNQARLCMSSVFFELGDYGKAEENLRLLLEEPGVSPEVSALAWGALGQCLEAKGNRSEAEQAYAKAAALSAPSSANIWRTAQARLLLGQDQKQSQALYKQVLDSSSSKFLRVNAARMLIGMGQEVGQLN